MSINVMLMSSDCCEDKLSRRADLNTDEELLDDGRCELGVVGSVVCWSGDGGVQDVDVSSHPRQFLLQPDVADHEDSLHGLRHTGDLVLGRLQSPHHDHTPPVGRQLGQGREVAASQILSSGDKSYIQFLN